MPDNRQPFPQVEPEAAPPTRDTGGHSAKSNHNTGALVAFCEDLAKTLQGHGIMWSGPM